MAEEIRVRRRTEYTPWNKKVKELMNENERKVDEEFDVKRY